MKILFTLLLTTAIALSAEPPAQPEYYKANEVSLDAFGYLKTQDFDDERTGAGIGLNYFYTKNWGIGIEGSAGNTHGIFVESARLNLLYRIPINKSAIHIFAGAGADFCVPPEAHAAPLSKEDEGERFAFDFGTGVEHRFSKHLGIFGDVRFDKLEGRGAQAIGRIGIRIPF